MTPYGLITSQGETEPQKRREPRYALQHIFINTITCEIIEESGNLQSPFQHCTHTFLTPNLHQYPLRTH
uniref:Uncharacterized protein n=1 Tax=Daphnia magna TaxID=35525 RepID=A0A0P5VZH8_9CRUS